MHTSDPIARPLIVLLHVIATAVRHSRSGYPVASIERASPLAAWDAVAPFACVIADRRAQLASAPGALPG
ncbi:hypothetical protein [Microbacterium rhizomatis]|uniref:Uncharacterized protein n=1 Tax=Microbacterium rhizomatis TaxID=1631477 RepID=A0A5J5J8F3_9MICO|nr:hypothetical protein [Microbacterium rhizomatis]KAA9111068.1 hypothetical protein F6B43_05500 [Microbacterium rhizomatis]